MLNRKLKALDRIEGVWADCEECPLSMGRNRIVYWRGSPEARLVAIGEGPGRDEDERGIPFVGDAGKTLDGLLSEAGLSVVDDIFITNVVGCRPPNNRQPTFDEMKSCQERLESMLWVVSPRCLLLMGGTAARLTGVQKVGQWRGSETTTEMILLGKKLVRYKTVVTWHPSYLNRKGGDAQIREQMIHDIKLAFNLAME